MDAQSLSGRIVDLAFCRAYADAADEVSDDEVLARAQATDSASVPLNPTEFLQQLLSSNALPTDFDWRIYAYLNQTEALTEPWQAALHYLRHGATAGRPHTWTFDPDFYQQLYHQAAPATDPQVLAAEWRAASAARFGCLQQAGYAAGFSTLTWLERFDPSAYIVYNGLVREVVNDTQAVVHFLTVGWRHLLPISQAFEFDPRFVREVIGDSGDASDAELYRRWLQHGLPADVPSSEAALLKRLDLERDTLAEGFDWQCYVRQHPAIGAEYRSKWGALEHFVRLGAGEPGILPMTDAAAWDLLIAIARRAARQGDMDRACRIIDRCALLGPATPEHLQSLGELEHIAGRPGRALTSFRKVRDAGQAGLLTFLRAGECALALGDAGDAIGWAVAGLTACPRSEHLDHLLLRAQTAFYDATIARHVAAMRAGRASSSDDLAGDLRALFSGMLAACRTTGAADPEPREPRGDLPGGRKLRVAMLANVDLPQCAFYRVTQKLAQLVDVAAEITIVERDRWHDFLTVCATADVALFYRVHACVPVLRCIAQCQANGLPTAYEIDDLVFDPEHFPGALAAYDGAINADEHFELRCGVDLVRFAIQCCDFGVASTDALRQRLQPLVRQQRAVTLRNCMPLAMLPPSGTPHDDRRGTTDDGVVIFYGSATRAHAADFRDLVAPALLRLLQEHPNVLFIACGHVDVTGLAAAVPDRVEHVPLLPDRTAYARLLAAADINLAVLANTPFNDCKSEIKWLEAAMLAVPTVASAVAGMCEVAKTPADLLLCGPDSAAWYAALRSLVVDPALRRAIGQHARATAMSRYQPQACGRQFERDLRGFLAQRSSGEVAVLGKARRRVLVVNVFYPPQAIGGATRVVADHVAALSDTYAREFAVAVVCANAEEAPAYRTQSYLHRGVRVYSISTAFKPHMDWLDDDPLVAPLFADVLAAVQPDLVHFHCIQRLGAGIVDAVAARGIPYVITLHDAWWISDHQFLIDRTGRLRLPWEAEVAAAGGNPHPRSATLARRRRLRACLDGAAAVNAVSDTFAAIYQRAGITSVEAIPNGIPVLPPLEPRPGIDGKVRLGHFGGIGPAKGLQLLRYALQRGRFTALTLLAIDDGALFGTSRRALWGDTEVTLVSRTSQDRIGALFGSIDVLVAPSVWPESFGLVVREALAYGKWVIASERGALAEPIVPGENGFLFDPDEVGALARLLQRVNDDPARFARSPARVQHHRTAADQTADYVALYRTLHDSSAGRQAEVARVA